LQVHEHLGEGARVPALLEMPKQFRPDPGIGSHEPERTAGGAQRGAPRPPPSPTSHPKGSVPSCPPCSSTPTSASRRRRPTGREMDFECACGRRCRLEHYLIESELL